MAREHLRENCIFGNDAYSIVSDEVCAKRGYRQKLTERLETPIQIDSLIAQAISLRERASSESDQKIFDKVITKLRDSGASEKKTWRLPIGRYDNLNGNKRIYPKELWNVVKDKQQHIWQGIAGLADHPEDDDDPGEFKNSAIVWLDMEVGDDGVVYGVGRFIGPYGHMAEEIIEAGGRIGLSSSGFGDVNKATNTVDPYTYLIERLADIVINPSQDVYASVDCPHTAADFMNDVHQGATIEFKRQETVRESAPQSAIMNKRRINEMAQQTAATTQQPAQTASDTSVDAVQQGVAPAQPAAQAPAQQPTQQPAQPAQQQPAQPAAQQPAQPVKESNMSERKDGLTKIEEKAFRKYVNAFIDDIGKMENPIHRLNEATEILSFFDNGACLDLREKLEEQIVSEKERLEHLIETTVQAESDFGIDIGTLRENAEKITASGLLLNEQVTDYKALVDELAKRNQKLVEANTILSKKLRIQEKLQEKTDLKKNQEIVGSQSKAEKLAEAKIISDERSEHLKERVSELSVGNKHLEKELGTTQTKLKEAAALLLETKEVRAADQLRIQELELGVKELRLKLQESESLYKAAGERADRLTETAKKLQEEIDLGRPELHVVPKFEDRVGKFFNLREGKGAEVEDYWSDLCEKYGEQTMKLFEHEIRDAKTLREATGRFLKYRTQIDPNFAIAQPVDQYAYRNNAERNRLLESQGVVLPAIEDNDYINDDFLKRANAAGLR